MLLDEFRAHLSALSPLLSFSIYKDKLAYTMVIWADGTDGTISGPFAGHSYNQRLPAFEYHGWCYAYTGWQWFLLTDGKNGWREKGFANPFPTLPEAAPDLNTWG